MYGSYTGKLQREVFCIGIYCIRLTLLLRYSVGKNTSRRQRPSLPQYEFGKPELEVIFK